MRVFLAGGECGDSFPALAPLVGKERIDFLVSYWYVRKQPNILQWSLDRGIPILLDCGAFTAHKSGGHIDLDEYIRYCHEHRRYYELIAALDVIFNPDATFENWRRMVDAGVECFPTFHLGEPWSALDRILEHTDMFAVGGLFRRGEALHRWLEQVFKRSLTAYPDTLKIHGFGLTAAKYLRPYPWYSVDSSTWLSGAAWGNLSIKDGTDLRGCSPAQARKDPGRLRSALGKRRFPGEDDARRDPNLQWLEGSRARVLEYNARAVIRWVDELNRGRAVLQEG